MAIDGGSAGGFTLLLLCARYPGLVRAAVDRYGVADLFDLAETTHRYESRYLDKVVGPLPGGGRPLPGAVADEPRRRDHRARCSSCRATGTTPSPRPRPTLWSRPSPRRASPVEYHVYEGEGHGWSKPETVADELERAEKFLTRWVLKR